QTLALSGTFAVSVLNQGNAAVTSPFTVAVFQDVDGDGRYTAGVDALLGSAPHTAPLAPGQSDTLAAAVSGTLRFRDDLIWAFADSERVIAELDEENNLNQTGAGCSFKPPIGQFTPAVEWQWSGSTVLPDSKQVMMTPLVIDLNGDGIPEIVFTTFTGSN